MKRASGTVLKAARLLGRSGLNAVQTAAEANPAVPSRAIRQAIPVAGTNRGFAATAFAAAEANVQVLLCLRPHPRLCFPAETF